MCVIVRAVLEDPTFGPLCSTPGIDFAEFFSGMRSVTNGLRRAGFRGLTFDFDDDKAPICFSGKSGSLFGDTNKLTHAVRKTNIFGRA